MTEKKPLAIRWILVIACTALGLYGLTGLKMSDDALDLLPGDAVRGDLQLLQRLGLVDRIFITLSVEDPTISDEQALAALKENSSRLGESLNKSDLVHRVLSRLPSGYQLSTFEVISPHLPALLENEDYQEIERLIAEQGIDQALARDFALLNSPAGIGMKHQIQADPLGFVRLLLGKLEHLRGDYSVDLIDGFFISKDRRSCLITAESRLPLTDSQKAARIEALLQHDFKTNLSPEITPRVIGTLSHTLANARMVKRDLRLLLPVATLLLALLLAITLRDLRAVVVLSIPFLAAPAAISISNMVFGKISGLALGFGIVLLGISIDFAIHLFLALRDRKISHQEALTSIRRPILLATATTCSVFIVLLFSKVAAHQQMATLALAGTLLAVLYSWLLIPLFNTARSQPSSMEHNGAMNRLADSRILRKLFFVSWLLLIGGGLLSWPQLRYNGNLQLLDAPDQATHEDEQHFRATWEQGDEQLFVVATGSDLDTALKNNFILYRHLRSSGQSQFQSLAPLLPDKATQLSHINNWKSFWQSRQPGFEDRFQRSAASHGFRIEGFTPFFSSLEQAPSALTPELLWKSPLSSMLDSMVRSPQTDGGDYLILTTVAGDSTLTTNLIKLDHQQPGITLLANEKWRGQVERLLREDIVNLSLSAGLCIVIIALFAFRRTRPVLGVLAPVLSALSTMSLFSLVSNGELNMMHLLMGIMVIGLSVDYGIFIISSRLKTDDPVAAKAVSICAASSLIGFGVLAFAEHPALHSLGITVLVGIGTAWPTAIFVSPLLAGSPRRNR